MTQPFSSPPSTPQSLGETTNPPGFPSPEPQASYVKLAMRNMVRKGGKSLQHFFLTTFGLLAILVGLAYLTH
ncbi:MAG TPA: DUF3285 domain-containing protein [Cyanobacteria bacterium UBA8803]|nr:DUF3285 domain-containing protein [Cyanobacteria bacterium UBA9273]HBL60723.1 DUF3285 domain-containing protein [Cyanobacteria bacterium UBA8803]